MTDLWGTGLIEGLPPAVADEPWVRIMDKVYRERHQREMEAAERIRIYTMIDSQPEEILDVLAVQFKVDWYDASYPLQAKRNIIKTALEVRRYYGTDWATLKAISAIYPRSEIEQWYDYGGTPGHFRVICSVDGALIPVKRREIRRSVNIYKRMTAHLDSLYLQVQAGLDVECEFSSLVYRVPYASETMYAGTWPRTTTHGGLADGELLVETEGAANAFRVEAAGTIPYRTTHAGILNMDFDVEAEHTAAMLETPYTSENQQAGTWPKDTTKAALADGEFEVEAEQQSTGYKVETAGTVPYRATTAGIYDTDMTVEAETEVHDMEATMAGTETCASNIPAVLDDPVLDVDVEVTATKFKGKRSGEEPFVQ